VRGFARLLGDFLLDYVPRRRNLSENTAMSYRDCFVLLLGWLDTECGVRPDDVEIADLGRERIEAFCLWLADARGCSAATVNVRLTAIRAFAAYVSFAEPAHLEWAREVRAIKFSKSPSRTVDYLSPEAVGAIVDEARSSPRDLAMLSLMYDSGARVSEICDALGKDLSTRRPATMRLVGKGRKARVVPICEQVAGICADYVDAAGVGPDELLFKNRLGNPMGRAGLAWVLSKHAASAHQRQPDLVPEKVHPHMLRHSKAMHLLESGVNLVYIRDFLGHSSVTTTEIYARASTKAKREAIEKAAMNVIKESAYDEERRSDLIYWLKGIM
jgi:site-specific recombinase XerD